MYGSRVLLLYVFEVQTTRVKSALTVTDHLSSHCSSCYGLRHSLWPYNVTLHIGDISCSYSMKYEPAKVKNFSLYLTHIHTYPQEVIAEVMLSGKLNPFFFSVYKQCKIKYDIKYTQGVKNSYCQKRSLTEKKEYYQRKLIFLES